MITGGSDTITVNQQSSGGQWVLLGTYTLDASSTVSLSSIADGYVVADAVRLVATTPPSPTGSNVYYSHNDHLGTPQAFTDENQTVVWQADYQPFGKVNETINTFANNLRFPGQYYDAETGQHYNYFRDYDPSTGRYVQSDPIGIRGGINTYLYASANPLIYFDPLGLVPGMGGKGASVMEAAADAIDGGICQWWPYAPQCRNLICVRWKCERTDDCGNTETYFIGRGNPYVAGPNYDPNNDDDCKCDTYCAVGHPNCPGLRQP